MLAALLTVAIFVPPFSTDGARYVFVETIQYCLAAFAVPALVVLGRPWGRLGGEARRSRSWRALEQLAAVRIRHPGLARALVFWAADVALVVLWRTPAWMDALVRDRWLVVLEVVSLAVAGVGLWLELIACPPLSPRLARPWRAVVAALAMWATWIMAYIVGFAHTSWYTAFDTRGGLLGGAADQEIATAIVWVVAIVTFTPAIFADVMIWLKSGEDPDAELRKLARAARRSQRF